MEDTTRSEYWALREEAVEEPKMKLELFELLEKYLDTYEQIHKNRDDIKSLTGDNQAARKDLITIQQKLEPVVLEAVKEKSLYKLCLEKYGKVDKHFHTLYALFGKKLPV